MLYVHVRQGLAVIEDRSVAATGYRWGERVTQ